MTDAKNGYTALYNAILRTLVAKWDTDALKTFLALSSYIDERGVCFPGVRQLAEDTDLTLDRVFQALATLEQGGALVYVRRDEHDLMTHRQLPDVYALNPQIVRVAQPLESAAFITLPIITKKPDRYYALAPIHNKNQDQESESTSVDQAPEPPPPTTTAQPPLERGSDSVADYTQKGQSKRTRHQQRSSPSAQSATSEAAPSTPPTPAPPPEPSDLAAYNAPLADPLYERTAQELVERCTNISHSTARMLVDVYGCGRARAALRLMNAQPVGSIANKAAYVRTILRRRVATVEDAQSAETPAAYENHRLVKS